MFTALVAANNLAILDLTGAPRVIWGPRLLDRLRFWAGGPSRSTAGASDLTHIKARTGGIMEIPRCAPPERDVALHRRFILFARFLEAPVPFPQNLGVSVGHFPSGCAVILGGGAICHSRKLTSR